MKITRVAQVFLAMSKMIVSQAQLSESTTNLRRTAPIEIDEVEYTKDDCTAVVEVDEGGEYKLLCLEDSGVAYQIEAATTEFIKKAMDSGDLTSGKSHTFPGTNCMRNTNAATVRCQDAPKFTNVKGKEKLEEKDTTVRRELDQSQENKNRDLGTLATQSVLVVRVIDSNGVATPNTKEELEIEVFDDPVNLKTIYDTCSHGKLTIVKAADRTGITTNIVNGVVEITVTEDVTAVDETVVRNSVISELNSQFNVGNPGELADHVMICEPSYYKFIAYAWANSWMTSYGSTSSEGSWCTKVSAVVHEIGHNLGLGHAGELTEDYGDTTGMMGYSSSADDGPVKCFNPPNYVQLGWFTDKEIILSAAHDLPWTGTLIGINEYAVREGYIAVVITTGSHEDDKYIGYNGAQGVNIETGEASNQVTVTKKGVEVDSYGNTLLQAKLGSLGVTSYENYLNGLGLEISVMEVDTVLGTADVSIQLSPCSQNSDCFDDDSECDVCVNGYCRWDTANCAGRIQLTAKTDHYPAETTIQITDECTQESVIHQSSYTEQGTIYKHYANGVPGHQYSVTVTDSANDGMCCSYGSGYYEIKYESKIVIHSLAEGASETKYFGAESCGATPPSLPTTPNPAAAPIITPAPITPNPTVAPTPAPITPNPTAAPVTLSPTPFPTPNPTNPPTATPQCIEANELCSLGTCCSNLCETSGNVHNRKCIGSTSSGTCSAIGYDCTANSDCCTDKCNGNPKRCS